jgi:hypothetical protein
MTIAEKNFKVDESRRTLVQRACFGYCKVTQALFDSLDSIRQRLGVSPFKRGKEYPYIPNTGAYLIALYIVDILKLKKGKIIDVGCGASPLHFSISCLTAFSRHERELDLYGLDKDPLWDKLYSLPFTFILEDLNTFNLKDYKVIYFYHPLSESMSSLFNKWIKEAKKGTIFLLHPMGIESYLKDLPSNFKNKIEVSKILLEDNWTSFIEIKIIK